MKPRAAVLAPLLSLAAFVLSATAAAHAGSLTYSFWRATPEGADVEVQLTAADLASLMLGDDAAPGHEEDAARRLQGLVTMRAGGVPCKPLGEPERVASTAPWMLWRWSTSCAGRGERVVSVAFNPLFEGGARHFVRWDDGSGAAVDQVLDLAKPSCSFGSAGASRGGSSFFDYLALGVEHLLTGWDHMVFVLALLLLAERAREVVGLVTSFTVAHSVTLALSALGVVKPDPHPVEALIGFSIALLGAENAWLLAGRGRRVPGFVVTGLTVALFAGGGAVGRVALVGLILFSTCHFALLGRARKPGPLRVAIAFAFGLVHGFGFAGVMAELRLPAARLVPALLGFNLGVELGQLGVVLVAWPLLRALRSARGGRWYSPTIEAASAGVCAAGCYWLVVRMFG